jgi:hypothetical protein
MNQRKASPAKGTRFSANATRFALVLSQSPGSSGSVGTEIRSNQNIVKSRIQNRMPAIAAAFGVLKFARVSVSSGVMLVISLVMVRLDVDALRHEIRKFAGAGVIELPSFLGSEQKRAN